LFCRNFTITQLLRVGEGVALVLAEVPPARQRDFRYWHKADALIASVNVRFREQSGHRPDVTRCPLMTQSGHRRIPADELARPHFLTFRRPPHLFAPQVYESNATEKVICFQEAASSFFI
jgi:hypothetical protein